MSRPRLLRALVATTVLVLSAACGAGSETASAGLSADACDVDAPADPVTLNVLAYTSPSIDPFSAAMTACTGKGKLTVKHGGIDFNGQLTKAPLSLGSDQPSYDVVEVYTATLSQYAAKGWLQPLDDLYAKYADRYQLRDIDPGQLDQFRYEGKLYALPMQVNVHEMVYRKDVFDKLGLKPPTTFDELVAALDKIKATGEFATPFSMPISASTYASSDWFNSLKSVGGKVVDEASGTPQLTSPQAGQAVESLQRLIPYMGPGAINIDESVAVTAMQTGKAAVSMMYSGSMGQLADPGQSQQAANLAFAAPPSVVAGGPPWATVYIDGFALAKNSKADPDLLFQVAAVGTGPAAAKTTGALAYPSRKAVVEDPALTGDPKTAYWPAVTDTLAKGATGPQPLPYFGGLLTAVRPPIAAAVFGQQPIPAALADAQRLATDFVAKNKA
jgi:multiple sugar transport system substrate-binding protein